MKKIEFEAPILQHQNINAAYVEFPLSTQELFGKKGQVKIKAVFDKKLNTGEVSQIGVMDATFWD